MFAGAYERLKNEQYIHIVRDPAMIAAYGALLRKERELILERMSTCYQSEKSDDENETALAPHFRRLEAIKEFELFIKLLEQEQLQV